MTDHTLRPPWLLILIMGMFILCGSALGHFKFLSAENEDYVVELIRWERYGPAYSDLRFVLLVRGGEKNAERTVTVENLTTGLESAEIVDRTLVLFGEMQSKADAITLVDLEAGKTIDFILHYGASLSPSRKYLIFKGFYPPYGMLQNRSDSVLLYELSKGPAENRLSGASEADSGQRVGLPVYPSQNANTPAYLVSIPEESERHYVDAQAGFLWTKDEESVFFIDKTGDDQLLVRVDVAEGPRQARISTRSIDAAPALSEDGRPEGDREHLAVTGMELEPDGRIRLELDRKLFERRIYRVTHMSVEPPEVAPPIQDLPETPQ